MKFLVTSTKKRRDNYNERIKTGVSLSVDRRNRYRKGKEEFYKNKDVQRFCHSKCAPLFALEHG